MSSNDGILQRSISFLRRENTVRGRRDDDEEVLPYRPVEQPSIVIAQVLSQDDKGRHTFCAELPSPIQLQRSDWPTLPKDQEPGSYFFDQTPTLTRTPWELERRKRQPTWHPKSRVLNPRVFEQLPLEVYQCIVDHVVVSHTHAQQVDVVATHRELQNLCLVSRRWARVSIESLYRELWLPSSKPLGRRRLSMIRHKSRLELLLRTLVEAPALASLVGEIRLTKALRKELSTERKYDGPRGFWAHETLTKVINSCSEVQQIHGYSLRSERTGPASHKAALDSLLDAICSRTQLVAQAWMLDAGWPPWRSIGRFIDVHNNWQSLETLVLWNEEPEYSGKRGLISAITSRLSSLKHLAIINFPAEVFHNGTLLALPALRSLRLENLDGINDQGLQRLADSRLSTSLERLTFVNLEIASFRTLQTLLAHFTSLRKFRLIQDCSPTLPLAISPSSPRATLRSSSVTYIHWDTLIPGPATEALATSVRLHHLPSLRTIKSPSDYDGILQSLCRPISQVSPTSDDLKFLQSLDPDRYVRSLRASSLQAQLRVRESRQQPSFNVVVQDEDAHTEHTHVIGSYLGDLSSKIEYVLDPDMNASAYGLANVKEVLAPVISEDGGEFRIDYRVLF